MKICGFLNTRNGVLLIGVRDGKNTKSGKPEVVGIENDEFNGDRDKYKNNIQRNSIEAW